MALVNGVQVLINKLKLRRDLVVGGDLILENEMTSSGVSGSAAAADIIKAIGPFVPVTGNTTLTAADSGKSYGAIPGGAEDPIKFRLPIGGATSSLQYFIFNAAGKPIRFECGGSEVIFLPTAGESPDKVQLDENFGFLEVVSTGLGSWVIVSGSGCWYNADSPTHFHFFDGNVHDGTDLIYTLDKGAHKFTTLAQRAQGLITVSGAPIADETFVVGGTTVTAKADGSGDPDWFTIGGTTTETANNILATLLEGSEKANIFARKSGGNKVLVEWSTGGIIGNGKTFTEAMTNVTMDGGGTLGGTHAGVDAATLLTINEAGAAEIKYPLRGATSLWKHYRQMGANSIGAGATGATRVPPDAAGANASIGGWQIDNNPAAEYLYFEFDIHDDWDEVSDITVNVYFEQEDAGGGAGQTTVLDLELYYKQSNESTSKGQSLTDSTVTGAGAAKAMHEQTFTIDYNPGGGQDVETGDLFTGRIWWDDVTSTDATHPIINHVEIEYLTKQPAIEA